MLTSSPSTAQPSVLLVEDDDDLRAAIADVLEEDGFQVRVAVDGVDALRMLADQGRPAVILSDLTMPRMDGWALAQALLENGATSGIPLCVMTALPSGHDIPSNAIALLRKPVVPERLLALLRRCARTASA